jgi:hypothetical protein
MDGVMVRLLVVVAVAVVLAGCVVLTHRADVQCARVNEQGRRLLADLYGPTAVPVVASVRWCESCHRSPAVVVVRVSDAPGFDVCHACQPPAAAADGLTVVRLPRARRAITSGVAS